MNNEEWLKRTNEIIADWESERQSLRDKYDRIASELFDLDQRIASGHELISAYVNKYRVESTIPSNVTLDNLAKKSYTDVLIDIAKQSNGILNIADATDILLKARIGSDRKAIKHNVTNSLCRSDHFTKIGRGQYRFTNHIRTGSQEGRVKRSQKSKVKRVKSGVKQAVKNLKEQNPFLTLRETTDKLINDGFDFKGKQPAQSVTMAWVALGYQKEGKQQKLPIPPVSSPVQETLGRPE